jgi:GNAT superfamily N-acetyltransferase
MAPIEPIAIERLDESAMEGALALSREAGWNQAADDWRIFFRGGTVLGVRDGGAVVATGAILPYDGFGWISMVLTTAPARGRGLGTAILRTAIAALDAADRVPVLDATPQGERIYRPLGFEPVTPLWRWRGEATAAAAPQGVRRATADDLRTIAAGDAAAFGADRGPLLRSLFERAPQAAFVTDKGGFVLARPGRTALQIGPVVAADEVEADDLLAAALAASKGPVLVDAVEGRTAIEARLSAAGFAKERPYLRMAHRRRMPFGDEARLFAIAGPELG